MQSLGIPIKPQKIAFKFFPLTYLLNVKYCVHASLIGNLDHLINFINLTSFYNLWPTRFELQLALYFRNLGNSQNLHTSMAI